MSPRSLPFALAAVGLALLAPVIPARATAALPQAGQRVETPVSDPILYGDVRESHVRLKYPLPKSAAAHPAECDWISYIRFRAADGPADPAAADGILVGMPGATGGASSLSINANQVVHQARAAGRKVEYWALDRRANCLEDHTGLDAGARLKDPTLAVGYYYNGRTVEGRRFGGFQTGDKLPVLAGFGLARTLDDQRAIIQYELPDPAGHKKVLCGGHSLGGLQAGMFAAWDFDGDTRTGDDAGYNLCGAGYFAIDTLVTTAATAANPVMGPLAELLRPYTGMAYPELVKALKDGTVPRMPSIEPLSYTKLLNGLALLGQAADIAPAARATTFQRVPGDFSLDAINRLASSRTWAEVWSDPRTRRLTNDAQLGTIIDDNSEPLMLFQFSIGTFDGRTRPKTFPTPNQLAAIPGWGEPVSRLIGTGHLHGTTDRGRTYGWLPYDRVGEVAGQQLDWNGKPVTTPDREVVDIGELKRTLHTPIDFTEWYFPTRQLTDQILALGGARTGDLAHIKYEDGPKRHPNLTVLGTDSFVKPALDAVGLTPAGTVLAHGYQHNDMVAGAARQNDGRPEVVSTALTSFALTTLVP